MLIYVNDIQVALLPGMTVRHALIAALGPHSDSGPVSVRDRWGNPVGLDGALRDGERITAVTAGKGDDND